MNLLKILVVVLVLIALLVAAIYLCGQFEQTRPIYDKALALKDQAVTYVSGNIPAVVAAGGGIVTVAGVAASKLSEVKSQLTTAKDQAATQISSLTAEKDKVAATVKDYQDQLTAQANQVKAATVDSSAIQNQLSSVTDAKSQLEIKYAELQKQFDKQSLIIQSPEIQQLFQTKVK
jgi:uncharacterized lipoprotein YehR (DUF1307 family)